MTDIFSTPASLHNDIVNAKPGDNLYLGPGNYGNQSFYQVVKAVPITLQSAHPIDKAIVKSFNFNACRGIHVNNVKLMPDSTTTTKTGFTSNGSDIRVDYCEIVGPPVATGKTPGDNGFNAVMLRDGQRLAAVGNWIHNFHTGVNILNNQDVEICDNMLYDIRMDGIRGESNNIVIKGNFGTDFYPVSPDHPDFIQLWKANRTNAVSNVLIEDNHWDRGKGKPVQGIFMGDEATWQYDGVIIRHNSIVGGMWHGIAIYNCRNVMIEDNFVQGYKDSVSGGQVMVPWVGVFNQNANAKGTVFAYGNQATAFNIVPDVVQVGQTTIAMANGGDLTGYRAWLGLSC